MAGLVGRDMALAVLRRHAAEARAGHGRFVLIDGEPGIGKTALATAAADEAAAGGAQVAWGVCVSGEGVPDFWPWPDIVAAAGGEPTALSGPAGAGPDAWFSAATAVLATLRAAAARAPVVVVIDDLQWAGAGTVRVLDFAARGLRRHPVLLLGTYRGVEVAAAHPLSSVLPASDVVPLAGLAVGDVAELLRPVLGARAGRFAAAVHTRTGGNPFFVQQVGLLAAGGTGDAVPAAVGDAIRRRFARLPQPTAALLGTAAVAGRDADAALVALAAGLDLAETVARLEPAVAARVLHPAGMGAYRFGHDLFWETAYADLAPGARARTHLALARALGSRREAGADVRAGDIAHHWARAVPPADPAEALGHVEAAAREATASLAHEEAARHWQQALRLAELAGPVPGGLRATYGEALLRAGQADAARRVLGDTASQTGDSVTLARCALGLHQAGLTSGLSHAEIIALLGRAVAALDAAPAGHPPPAGPSQVTVLSARTRAALARELADGPDLDLPRARALAGAAVAAAEVTGDPATLAFCLFAQHDVEWAPGTARRRLALAGRMAQAAARGGDQELEFQAGLCRYVALLELIDPAAEAALVQLEDLAQRTGQPRLVYLAASRRAAYTLLTGPVAEAERQINAAAELADTLGEPDGFGVRATQLIALGLARGGAAGVGAMLRSFDRSEMMPPEFAAQERAFRRLADGDQAAAAAVLRAAPGAADVALFRWRALAAAAFDVQLPVAAGVPELISAQKRAFLGEHAGEMVLIGGAVCALGPVDLFLGIAAAATGDQQGGAAHLGQAAAQADRIGARGMAAWARVELAEVSLRSGDMAGARALLGPAAAAAGELGLDELRDRAAALLTAATSARPAPTLATTGPPTPALPASGPAGPWRSALVQPAQGPPAEFRRTGEVWTLTWAGTTTQLADAKGLHDLAALLAVPGQEISALRLCGRPEPDTGADEVLDQRARAEYQQRLADLAEEIDAAEAAHDGGRAARYRAEHDALVDALAAAYGLGGRVRRLGDPAERARSTVTARIRDSLRRIDRAHPALGAHLRASVSTGRCCVYRPEPPVRWML